MNHFMLPNWNGLGLASPKYGNIAIEHLIKKMNNLGSENKNLIAKMFGGAAVLKNSNDLYNIGERNIEIAEKILQKNEIKIVASSVAGERGRKIIFNTKSGEVKMRYVRNSFDTDKK